MRLHIKNSLDSLSSAWRLFRQALAGNTEEDYTRGPVNRAVILLAIPMVIEMLMESVFAVVDMFFVAKLGIEAVAAVGLTEAVIILLYAVAVGLSISVTAMVARRYGEKNPEAAAVVAGQALWIGLIVATLTGIPGALFAPEILRLMGAEAAVIHQGAQYTAILLGGSVTVLYLFLINAVFRGAGDAATAMRALWLANGINIVLDPCLIFGLGPFPEMGVTGAAVATTIGRGIGVLYQLYHLFNVRARLTMQLRHLRPVADVMLQLLRVSIGGIAQFLIATASWLLLMKIVARYGSAAVAGYIIAIRIIDFTILPAWGIGNAASTLVGQNLGAGNPTRAEQSVWKAAKYNFVFMVSVALLFIFCTEPLLRIFTDDPIAIRYGVDCLRMVAYGYGFFAIGMIVIQAFNGAGDTITPTWINFCCYWLLQIPLAYTLAEVFGYGPEGVFTAILVAEAILAIVGVLMFRRGRWKLKAV